MTLSRRGVGTKRPFHVCEITRLNKLPHFSVHPTAESKTALLPFGIPISTCEIETAKIGSLVA